MSALFSFGAPAMLFGLLALPVIWWLLRLTPPRPVTEIFPPFKLLASLIRTEEKPNQSPWWLTLLRLLMAALVILALASPILNPRERVVAGTPMLALVIDNDWSSATNWKQVVATAERLIGDAGDAGAPIIVALTAEQANSDIGPFDAVKAMERLRAAKAQPLPTNRPAIFARVAPLLVERPGATLAYLGNGLAASGDAEAFSALLASDPSRILLAQPDAFGMIGFSAVTSEADALSLTGVRNSLSPLPVRAVAGAYDDKGRRIANATLDFSPGEPVSSVRFAVPFELRNDFSQVRIDGQSHAAATWLMDENTRRRRVGLISTSEADQAQPLLSPLFYISRALAPFANLIEAETADLAKAIPALLAQNPAIIIMADVGIIPAGALGDLEEWVEGGGTLVRFAGPRLAASSGPDNLLAVPLRYGERALGGALSWTEPQPLAEFPASGPFFDLTPPRDVFVDRQVLAEPTPDIVERSWASLADGTPLVTGRTRGKGNLVLFHVTPEATWSNLPISGSFVEMLRRIVQLSSNQGRLLQNRDDTQHMLPPFLNVMADGTLGPPSANAKPLPIGVESATVSHDHPPGLYGTDEGLVAHNLLNADSELLPLEFPAAASAVIEISYGEDETIDLKGQFLAVALLLMALDGIAVLWMGGAFAAMRRRIAPGHAAAMLLTAALLSTNPGNVIAQESQPQDSAAIEAITVTRLAYVRTGNNSVDGITRAGLSGLSHFLRAKTALEPGDPVGVDIGVDELSFYPLIYWAVDPSADLPSDAAMARLDAYMQQGGTVLFDTRDQFSSGLDLSSAASPATMRLRDILGGLNIPALEPVPPDHVLTKSFFILDEFPGRFRGSPLWVEASLETENGDDRPVRVGDGVSPILITANDFAGAWAVDSEGKPLLPTVPPDPLQRVYALRSGVNIMMYMLTGNYKSDQVHIPVLLERLGQ